MFDKVLTKKCLFARDENPFGDSWEQWTTKWWQWLLAIPKDINPALDTTGELFSLATQDRNSKVIFLPGNLGGSSVRTYVLPLGKALLIPIINFTTSYSEEPNLKSEPDLVERAKKDIDDIVERFAEVDGWPIYNLEEYRVHASPFEIFVAPDNIFNIPPGDTTAVSDGYWIFLRSAEHRYDEIHTIGFALREKRVSILGSI